jgi:hypothetical protein
VKNARSCNIRPAAQPFGLLGCCWGVVKVKLVAVVRSVDAKPTRVVYQVEDHTGAPPLVPPRPAWSRFIPPHRAASLGAGLISVTKWISNVSDGEEDERPPPITLRCRQTCGSRLSRKTSFDPLPCSFLSCCCCLWTGRTNMWKWRDKSVRATRVNAL